MLAGWAFDHLSCKHTGEFDQNSSKKSNAQGFSRGGGGAWAVLVVIIFILFTSNSGEEGSLGTSLPESAL